LQKELRKLPYYSTTFLPPRMCLAALHLYSRQAKQSTKYTQVHVWKGCKLIEE